MKNIMCLILMLCIGFSLCAQVAKPWLKDDKDKKYEEVPNKILGEDSPESYSKTNFFWGSSFDYAVYRFSNILMTHLNNKREQQRIEMERQQSIAKLNIIKSQYSSYDKYPDSIVDGWHNAIATDNMNFCKDVKVLVKNNRIKKFIIDNYIPLNFIATGKISNAKNVVSLKNFNGEQLNIVEVYFIYDIEEHRVVMPPVSPGYVCFWSDHKKYTHIQLDLNGNRMQKFTVRHLSEPSCFQNGMICRILKPGIYSYEAHGKGAIDWIGTFEVKENMCLKIRLGR